MPTTQASAITPEIIKDHGITPEEYERIKASLDREPSLTELGIFSVMWSEHCSYKSSRVHLKRLPTRSKLVVQGPGENAGIIDIGDGWACAFKIESHNHPSFIEPFQGAATGVGGILRDIFTMGARPFAVMDSLRFGPITATDLTVRAKDGGGPSVPPQHVSESLRISPAGSAPTERLKMGYPSADQATVHRNHSVLEGVVSGIASYGNCFGVPNLGGETKFEPCYSGNPLVNAFALGLVRRDQIFYAKAAGEGNPVIYVGAKTGRDGIHGATMASEEFSEGSEQKRPNVQVGDPFLEKLLLEACVEAMHTGAVVGIQDMGAAGLTCSTCEMGARGGVGIAIELDLVPQRETGMNAYEIMLSESQERMLLVAESGREQEVLKVFEKWGLDGVIVGRVTSGGRLRVLEHGKLVADIPNTVLTDDAPLYHRPMEPWSAPVSRTKPESVKWSAAGDLTENLKRLLAAPNICSKRWIFEQYDSMVQSNTVEGPGADAGLMRIKGSKRALAMALDGNGRWCWLDPKLGAMHAVAESARNVSCTGATPVAATNCLNFGNPEKPQIMWQFSQVVDGLTEACTVLETPITGGNVSLYNETLGEGIYPTPVIGIVGTLENVEDAMMFHFRQPDSDVFLLSGTAENGNAEAEFGSSEYAKEVLGQIWGVPPALDLKQEAALQNCLRELIKDHAIESAHDCSDGGLAVALAEASFVKPKPGAATPQHSQERRAPGSPAVFSYIGVEVDLNSNGVFTEGVLFGEAASRVVISCDRKKAEIIKQIAVRWGVRADRIGRTIPEKLVISIDGNPAVSAKVSDLRQVWDTTLVKALHVDAPEHLVPELLQKS